MKNYPIDLNSKELKEKVNEFSSTQTDRYNSSAHYAKAMLGLVELHSRENKKIAIMALFVSVLALLVSIYK